MEENINQCEVCGNSYAQVFEIRFQGSNESHWFDCFECASHQLAPVCGHCGVKVLGHGVQVGDNIFCCGHCSRAKGFHGIVDHTELDTLWSQQRER